jgi:hypothetical protein
VQQIPYTTCHHVPEEHCRMVTCYRRYLVPEVKTCVVPYTTCRMVSEEKCQVVNAQRCRYACEEKIINVPYTTCRMVSETVSRQVPHTVCTMQPYCESYKVCKMIPVCVPVCVPAAPACTPSPAPCPPAACDWKTTFKMRLAGMGRCCQ